MEEDVNSGGEIRHPHFVGMKGQTYDQANDQANDQAVDS